MSYTPRPDIIYQELQELRGLVQQLLTQAPLGYTSITEGSLRVASEEGLIVEGSALINGLLSVLGRVRIHGLGILEVLSLIDLLGNMRVRDGGVVDVQGGGQIKVGEIVIANGKITVGDMVIDLTDGGSVTFPGGAVVRAGTGGGIEMRDGSYAAVVTDSGASVGRIGRSISVTESGFRMDGLPTGSPGVEYPEGVIYKNSLGELREASGA